MSIAAVKIKLMPESPNEDLKRITEEAKDIIIRNNGKNPSVKEIPIAFGLKSLELLFAWPEEKELDTLTEELNTIGGVSTAEVEDIRRALG